MKEKILSYVVTLLLSSLSAEEMKHLLDRAIDIVEQKVADSESQVDDILLPVLRLVREVLSIPDYPDK